MTPTDLQRLIGAVPDGNFGPISRAAVVQHFANLNAAPVHDSEIAAYAAKLGCTVQQIKAVAAVESSGSGFDRSGRPKILFERHLFHRLTGGKFSPATFSQIAGGGYGEDSWVKLGFACGKDPDAAFSACSWGKFQVLGLHWSKLGYAGPYALARSTVDGEAGHYELLARFILTFGLTGQLRALSSDPADCRAFAAAYNGPNYRQFSYDTKLAKMMGAMA